MISQAKVVMKAKNWVHGGEVEDDQVGQINLLQADVVHDILQPSHPLLPKNLPTLNLLLLLTLSHCL